MPVLNRITMVPCMIKKSPRCMVLELSTSPVTDPPTPLSGLWKTIPQCGQWYMGLLHMSFVEWELIPVDIFEPSVPIQRSFLIKAVFSERSNTWRKKGLLVLQYSFTAKEEMAKFLGALCLVLALVCYSVSNRSYFILNINHQDTPRTFSTWVSWSKHSSIRKYNQKTKRLRSISRKNSTYFKYISLN